MDVMPSQTKPDRMPCVEGGAERRKKKLMRFLRKALNIVGSKTNGKAPPPPLPPAVQHSLGHLEKQGQALQGLIKIPNNQI